MYFFTLLFEPTAKFNLKEDRLFFLNRFSNWILSPCAKIYNYAELFVGRAGFASCAKISWWSEFIGFPDIFPSTGGPWLMQTSYCKFHYCKEIIRNSLWVGLVFVLRKNQLMKRIYWISRHFPQIQGVLAYCWFWFWEFAFVKLKTGSD